MITLSEIQKRIAEIIKHSDLSQAMIGKNLNISQQTVSHYIKGDKLPALDTFANFCKFFDVSADYILGLENYDGSKIKISNNFNNNNINNINFNNK